MKKILLTLFVTMIVVFSIYGYFYQQDPSLDIEQATNMKKESNLL